MFLLLCPPPVVACCSVVYTSPVMPDSDQQGEVRPKQWNLPVTDSQRAAVVVCSWFSGEPLLPLKHQVTVSSAVFEHPETAAPPQLTDSWVQVQNEPLRWISAPQTGGESLHRPLSSFTQEFHSHICKRSITAVLVCRRDDDIHPNPHGYWIGSHQEEEPVVGLHTERQTGPRRLKEDRQ